MGVQKELKCTFLTAFEHRQKRGSQLVCCTIFFIAVVSECLCHL